jgi:peptidoglycan/LPS O-acetylase OafA/YrhL
VVCGGGVTIATGPEAATVDAKPRADNGFSAYRATQHFAALDVLRAFSILAVIWHHSAAHYFSFPLSGQGAQGVTLFFVISGFLIVTLILRGRDKSGDFSIARFYARRTARIWPAYFFVLAVYVLVVGLLEKDAGAKAQFFANLPYFATFTSNLFVDLNSAARVIFYFAWSLAAEQQFYVIWPWVERYVPGLGPLKAALAVVAASTGLAMLFDRGDPILQPLLTFPGAIGSGVVLAHVLHRPEGYRAVAGLMGLRGAGLVSVLVLLTILSLTAWLGPLTDPLVNLAATALVAASVVREDNDMATFCRSRAIVWLGVVSYGVYLFHMLAINIVRKIEAAAGVQSNLIEFAGGAVIATAIASVSYLTLERYFLRR